MTPELEREIASLKHQCIEQAKAWAKDSDLSWETLLGDACAERLPFRRWRHTISYQNGAWHLEILPR